MAKGVYQRTEEHKAKLRELVLSAGAKTRFQKGHTFVGLSGRVFSEKHIQNLAEAHRGQVSWNKGIPMSDEAKRKSSEAHLGKSPWNKGMYGYNAGETNPNWKGGKGTERHKLMQQQEYILWRTAVFMRDDYTCQECGDRGVELNADHIKPWALYPDLRYAIDNGRTLCVSCHRQTDTWGGKSMYRKEGA